MRTRLTRIGRIFLALMLLFYVASVTSQSGLLLLLIGLMGGCFAVNWSFARRNVAQTQVMPPREMHLVEGQKTSQPWRIENSGSKHVEMVEIASGETELFRVPLVPVGEVVSLVPEIVYPRRGVYFNAGIRVSSSAPYGLLRATRLVKAEGQVVVYPRVYEVRSPAQTGTDFIAGGRFRGARRVNNGTHFAGVRQWQPGDSIRQIHWKATARREELMVKTFEEELGGRVTLILDAGGSETDLVDQAVRAAASLGVAALHEGHHLELAERGGAPFRWAPFSDEHELLERMAAYHDQPEADFPQIDSLWRRSAIALVGTAWNEVWRALLNEALRQNRRVYIYLPAGRTLPEEVGAELWHFDAQGAWSVAAEAGISS